jgi:hypothetical protein
MMNGDVRGLFGSAAAGREKFVRRICAIVAVFAIALAPQASRADEGGISFWAPGTFGSLAALPGTPGLGFVSFYYHNPVRPAGFS